MKQLGLAACLHKGESGVGWHPCACSSAVPATEECSDTTGQCVRSNKDDLPANCVRVIIKAEDEEIPVSLQEHQTDSHWMRIKEETLDSQEEYTEQKLEKPDSFPERLETKELLSENEEKPVVQYADQEQFHKSENVPISAGNTQHQTPEIGQGSSTKPKLKKPQRTYIENNSAIINEPGKYFKTFQSADQKTDIQEKLSLYIKKENILNNPPPLRICQQENTIVQGTPLPSTDNEINVTRSLLLDPHQDTSSAESGKSVDGLSLQRQLEKRRRKRYLFTECEKSYSDLSALKKQHNKHTGKRYPCAECEKSFGDLSLKRHHDKHTGKRYPCSECGKTYIRIACLKTHKIMHTVKKLHPGTRPVTDVTSNLASLQGNHDKHTVKRYPCKECEKSYSDLSALKKHYDKHTGKRYPCTECEKSFGDLSTLKRHHDKHTGKRYLCTECGRTYSRISCLKRHEIKHSVNRPVPSTRPGTDVTSNLSQQEHNDKHTVKRYLCPECKKSFSGLSALKRHHEKHTGKRYPCTECEKSFSDLSALRKHHEKHTGIRYLCTDCEKSFCNLSTLKRHSEKHIGKRYPCMECGKTYSRNSCLNKHKIVHTVNKPHAH
ncbi:hypothetical protein NDU88_000070 [Pleurodeles waltl]|uniref:C2H2-type domain-containing protein n=1 Tax=Pleurodeles waltl TaxID=8319 RepID=A0AAV7SVJ0_PLEWA|nr:hypothetical protein NDU88_000070 [Pleurodeles waltl]